MSVADRLSPEARSANMARVRSRDTKPELFVRKLLHRKGFRFRLHRRDLQGRPDLFLPKHKLAIFVHGCFWHGHSGCPRAKLPTTRADFWRRKIEQNRLRDEAAVDALQSLGISTVILWQCQLNDEQGVLDRIQRVIEQDT